MGTPLHAEDLDPSSESRSALVARRLRVNASAAECEARAMLPWFAVEHVIASDLGHLHRGHDLRSLPYPRGSRLPQGVLRLTRRLARRAIHPLPEAQTVWNGANARVVTFLLDQLSAQARAIESLEREVAALQEEVRR